ncbi:MAG TPA: thiamine pyrophosphate-dependent enzyme, partial [Beutenbergiaceae bacterium]|nr:thiamine pyrophosphate-dependent enzyme [Beutenbergiaceae bacterium]
HIPSGSPASAGHGDASAEACGTTRAPSPETPNHSDEHASAEARPASARQPDANPDPPHPAPAQIDRIAQQLGAAERPLLILGRGAHLAGAGADLREIGDRLGALFATSAMAAGLPASPWNLGIAGGFSTPAAWDLITAADVVLAVGISLNDFQDQRGALLAGAREVIQVDLTAGPTHPRVDTFVHADAATFAAALLDRLPASSSTTWRDRAPHAAGDLRIDISALPEITEDGRLDPRVVARRLDELLPSHRALVHDGGQFIGWMPQHARIDHPSELLLVGTALQTIGLGSASAVGAARARPDRTTVLVTGDGGGLMGLADLATFVSEVRSGVVVVFNDAAYGAELHQYAVKGVHEGGMLLPEVDFAALGTALGARGERVRKLADLDVLGEWVDGGAEGVLVLDIAVSRTIAADFFREH